MLPGVKLPRGKKSNIKNILTNIFIASKISLMELHLKI